MTLPIELVGTLACVGVFFIAGFLLWLLPQVWYRIKHSKYRSTFEELELVHLKEIQELKVAKLETELSIEKSRADAINLQLEDTLQKLVSRI
jgi:hypothetical protein